MSLQTLVQKKLRLEHQWANQALEQKQATDDMKLIDLQVKNIKGEINDQCVTDAKTALEVQYEPHPGC